MVLKIPEVWETIIEFGRVVEGEKCSVACFLSWRLTVGCQEFSDQGYFQESNLVKSSGKHLTNWVNITLTDSCGSHFPIGSCCCF